MLTDDIECYNAALSKISNQMKHKWNIKGEELMLPMTICTFSDPDLFESSIKFVRLLEITFNDAKSMGSNVIIEANAKSLNDLTRYMQIEAGINEAVKNDKFDLYIQPIYSIKENRYVAAEALLRYNHPTLGQISPDEFIPIAENNGSIVDIDQYMLRKVCRFINEYGPFQKFGLDILQVNLSTVDLRQDDLYEKLIGIIESENVDFGFIGLEITESAATNFTDSIMGCLRALDAKGIRIFLDDFGSGYSNMSRISHLPLYALKMDKSMLNSYLSSWRSATVFENIISMCKRLGFLVIVEGVSTEIQSEILYKLKVDQIQGFYYAKPMPAKDFLEFLKKG